MEYLRSSEIEPQNELGESAQFLKWGIHWKSTCFFRRTKIRSRSPCIVSREKATGIGGEESQARLHTQRSFPSRTHLMPRMWLRNLREKKVRLLRCRLIHCR